jgi:hypothetical protein
MDKNIVIQTLHESFCTIRRVIKVSKGKVINDEINNLLFELSDKSEVLALTLSDYKESSQFFPDMVYRCREIISEINKFNNSGFF